MDACFHAFFLLFSNIIPIFAPVIRLFRYKHNKKNDNLTYKEVRMDFFKEIKNPVKFLRHIDISGFLFHRGNEGCLGTRFLSDGNTITVKNTMIGG